MESLGFILFICLIAPLSMILFVFKGKTKAVISFLMLGILMCFISGEVSGLIKSLLGLSRYYTSVNVSPVVEEILKAIPILVYAYIFKPNKKQLLECALVTGIGFAILENATILAQNINSISITFAISRGFGSGMMHGICTLAVGCGMTFVRNDNRIAICGTFSLVTAAIMYHSMYNCIVQSEYKMFGVLLPVLTFIPIVIVLAKRSKK